MSAARALAPYPAHRLIPSCFPPIGLFDTVATAADLEAVMELAGWTNDRLAAERIARLPQAEWVFGRANSSIVMAAFLHVAPQGMRFNGPDLGAWYAAASLTTAVVEVAHHLRREAHATGAAGLRRTYRSYAARLTGAFYDLRGQQTVRPELYDSTTYDAGQVFGEALRASGEAGILFDSLRHEQGLCVVAYRPSQILDVTQADHFEVSVDTASSQIRAVKLGV